MDAQFDILELEKHWDFDTGFFGLLRKGQYDSVSFNRLVQTIERMSILDDSAVNRRAVSLLWYMPVFMGWQRERVMEAGGDVFEFDKATNIVQNLIERILGVP